MTLFLTSNDVVAFVNPSQQHVTEVNRPDTVVDFLEANWVLLGALARKSRRFLRRLVPALVTRLTRKCPGYSTGGRAPEYARGEGR